ncbi:multiheme c-type cytochrome [Thiolapillus brandeum]|uniref:Cytochrome c-552/4 domain-containing protein n=1 Tax=Thiolapillus brandeum TaxID=1076588 RepID=A0A7U6GJV8_9GAMM|nr:multiheme c-type cytochrome [Thiolapillus brandeum]BAO44915.1 hypothetical protein TBH_C2000 [Thiolapillus brandeum]
MNRLSLIILAASFFSSTLFAAPNPLKDPKYCGACHQRIYKEWASSRMAATVNNPRVYQFYTGTNPEGKKDGLGFQPFTHGEKGDCADCHLPELVLDESKKGREVDLGIALRNQLDFGVSCNFCHSLSEIHINKDINGRYKTRIVDTVKRDPTGAKHGPYTDAKSPAHPATKDDKIRSSELCGVCHLNQEKFLSISTYVDWKKAYTEGKTDKTCQECHMPSIEKAVLLADTATDRPKRTGTRSHTFVGSHDPGMLRKALSLKVDAISNNGVLEVNTIVENIGAGHKVPGSGPIRNVILKIDVTDANGAPLKYIGSKDGLLGPLAGFADPKTKRTDSNDWAGMPGKMYAKAYASKPVPSMGNKPMIGVGGFAADKVLFDTALKPFEPDHAKFKFKLPMTGSKGIQIKARLVYRDAFKPLADSKHWKLGQRDMVSITKVLP